MKNIYIDALDNDARGIGVLPSGKKIFIPEALPGETVSAYITHEEKNHAAGTLKQISVRSERRIREPGELRAGCNLSHLRYEGQLAYKQEKVRSCLIRIGRVPEEIVDRSMKPVIAAERTEAYRNHMQYKIRNGLCCLMAPSTNDPVYEETYLTEYRMFTSVRRTIEDIFRDAPTGLFSELVLRGSERTHQILIEFVTDINAPHEVLIRDAGAYISSTDLRGRVSSPGYELCGITLRISGTASTKRTRTGKRVILDGEDSYREILSGKEFRIRAGAFFQVNTEQAEKLYAEAAGLTKDADTIYDIYCGTGSIGITLLSEDQSLIGIESVKEAVDSARENARLSGIKDARFICRKAEDSDLLSKDMPRADVMIVDPPRKGMHPSFVEKILRADPSGIVYISCDPATLGRDIRLLRGGGYEIESVRPCDLFPNCSHVETVALLRKKGETGNGI